MKLKTTKVQHTRNSCVVDRSRRNAVIFREIELNRFGRSKQSERFEFIKIIITNAELFEWANMLKSKHFWMNHINIIVGASRRSLTLARIAFGAGEGNCVCAGLRVWSAHGARNKPGTRNRGRLYANRELRITRATVRKTMSGDRPATAH
jgi:hypothetical protein